MVVTSGNTRSVAAPREHAPPIARERLKALVKELKRERKLLQHEIAKQVLGLSPEHLSRLLGGSRALTLDLLDQIARKVGFDPHYFTASEGLSYKDYQRGPEYVLTGKAGASRLLSAVNTADSVLLAAVQGNDVPEMAEALAIEVLSLPAVLAAYHLLSSRDADDHRREGVPLAWAVKHLVLDAERCPRSYPAQSEDRKTPRT